MAAAPAHPIPVASLDVDAHGTFLIRVYQHLAVAVLAFVAIEALLFSTGIAEAIYDLIAGNGAAWLLILGGFMVINWLATTAAHDVADTGRQYLGLFAMALGEALIFAPFLYYVFEVADDSSSVVYAAAITGIGFAALTVVGLITRADLSFLRPLLIWAGVSALVLILAAVLFGLELGVWFSVAMIAVAGASILYQTQTILRHYPEEAYVGASVQLFASVMLLFWYVLRLVSQMRG